MDTPRGFFSESWRQPRPLKHLSDYLAGLVAGRLWLKVLIGMVLGIFVGIVLGPSVGIVKPKAAAVLANWMAFPGHLFLAAIQMIVVPLVVASVVRGLAAGGDLERLKRMGTGVVIYFVATTAVAIVIGMTIAGTVRPGRYIDSSAVRQTLGSAPKAGHQAPARPEIEKLPEKLVLLLPKNPLSSMVEGQMLQVVLFALVMGMALIIMPAEQARPLLDLMGSLQEVCMTVVRWAMLLAPLAVFGLLVQLSARVGLRSLLGMSVYVGTVLLGLFVLLVTYLALLLFFTRQRPLSFLSTSREVLLLAFSTSSSAAVMPLSIKTAEEKLGVHPSIAQFVIPLGATINMNGTALYQGVAAIFLAQVFDVNISWAGMLLIVFTAVGASIGSPATPGVGIVVLAMVLDSVGIPTVGIALIMGVDRILDMSRTAINVCGDIVACTLMQQWMPPDEAREALPPNAPQGVGVVPEA